jgi:uncharacterized protein YndB with AHSA1/START domain
MELKFTVQTRIQRPVAEVFDAVQNPEKLSRYFNESASGPLTEGAVVNWRFTGYPGEHPVRVRKVVPRELIVFEWDAHDGTYKTRVEMKFQPLDEQSTMVSISESGWKETPEGLKNSYDNCQGWTQMASGLKAYLEHGIDLR